MHREPLRFAPSLNDPRGVLNAPGVAALSSSLNAREGGRCAPSLNDPGGRSPRSANGSGGAGPHRIRVHPRFEARPGARQNEEGKLAGYTGDSS